MNKVGIYIHWPFCLSKCPYCDFNSHVSGAVDQKEWSKAFVLELGRYHEDCPEVVVSSVFFGGGTPSLMEPELVETILTCIAELWGFTKDVEITLEANPTSVEAGKFRDFRSAGVNRLSVGIQSLNDGDLRRLGRLHSASEALKALEIAQNTFLRVSFDLIYARQDQSLEDWRAELSRGLSFGTEHLSLYQLTIEDGTAFGKLHAIGKLDGLPIDDLSADMYFMTQELCENAGLPAYEVSNHSKPCAQSNHNLTYWRGGDFIGIGPGAHGRITAAGSRFATETNLSPDFWLKAALSGSGESLRNELDQHEIALEYLMMSLRLGEGLDLRSLGALDKSLLNNDKVSELVGSGHLVQEGDRLIATTTGRMVLNSIISEIANV
jgi:putative oxygen-independent coproporphyrinogen III oxidase